MQLQLPALAMSAEERLVLPNPNRDGAPPQRPRAISFQQAKRKHVPSSYGTLKSLWRGKRTNSTVSGISQQSSKLQDSAYYPMQMEPPTPMSEQAGRLDEQPKLSYKAKFASFLFKLIVFLLVLVSAALSKVCFVNIAAQLNANSSVGQGSGGEKRRSVAFVQLVLVLCVPQAVTILKTLFLGILGKTTKHFPWPTKRALLKVCVLACASGCVWSCMIMCAIACYVVIV